MTTKTRPRRSLAYTKEELLKNLKDAESRIEATIKTHEEQFAFWKLTIKDKLAALIDTIQPNTIEGYWSSWRFNDLKPPVRSNVCSDHRIQRIKRQITRIGMLAEEVVWLYDDDEIFNDIQLAQCLDEVPV